MNGKCYSGFSEVIVYTLISTKKSIIKMKTIRSQFRNLNTIKRLGLIVFVSPPFKKEIQ